MDIKELASKLPLLSPSYLGEFMRMSFSKRAALISVLQKAYEEGIVTSSLDLHVEFCCESREAHLEARGLAANLLLECQGHSALSWLRNNKHIAVPAYLIFPEDKLDINQEWARRLAEQLRGVHKKMEKFNG